MRKKRKMFPVFCVIIEVPKWGEEGNLSDDLIYKLPKNLWNDGARYALVDELPTKRGAADRVMGTGIHIQEQVFRKGEILIVDNIYGREYGYPGRKPSKWVVKTETFRSLKSAIKRARELA